MTQSLHPFHAFLRTRRSIRRFLPQPVPPELLSALLETAAWAPSAHNRQPWRFVVVENLALRERLAEAMGAAFAHDLARDGLSPEEVAAQVQRSRQRMLEAPALIIFCLTMAVMDAYPDAPRQASERVMAVQSVALAVGNLLLAAHAEGLGGVWVCAPLFAPAVVSAVLELPPDWEPQGMVFLGYPARVPPPRTRQLLQEVVRLK